MKTRENRCGFSRVLGCDLEFLRCPKVELRIPPSNEAAVVPAATRDGDELPLVKRGDVSRRMLTVGPLAVGAGEPIEVGGKFLENNRFDGFAHDAPFVS